MTSPAPTYQQLKLRLYLGLSINAVIIAVEFIGGYLIDSLGLMSDAGHNLIDQGSLFLALYAHVLAARPATETRTFGFHRAGILASFVNGLVLLVTAVVLGFLALRRIQSPVPVPGGWVIIIALVSFAANLGVAILLQHGAKDDLNIRGAFWHMLADAWVSLGVAASGLGILYTDWSVLDSIVSLVIVGVVVKGAWPIFRESLDILLESTPPGVNTTEVIKAIEGLEDVRNVHDLHIWAVEPRLVMLTCHVMVESVDSRAKSDLLSTIQALMAEQFSIHHLTVQLETQCTDPDTVHCDLRRLTNETSDDPSLHQHTN